MSALASSFVFVGKVYYRAHPATPLVLGDFAVMKRWPGAPDGEAEGPIELEDGTVFGFSSNELAPPFVYASSDAVVLLVPPQSYGRKPSAPTGEELEGLLTAPCERAFEQDEIEIPSGAMVITVAYNATPEVGADTSALDELCFHKNVPLLPTETPSSVVYEKELAIIPLAPGAYSVEAGIVGGYERVRCARVAQR